MDDLIAFWTARLDEAEAVARGAGDGSSAGYRWHEVDPTGQPGLIGTGSGDVVTFNRGTAAYAASPSPGQAAHIALNDPAAALADIAADRALIALLGQAEREDDYDASRVLREVASIRAARFSDHPDYKQEWAP
jgi:hypothetical protein